MRNQDIYKRIKDLKIAAARLEDELCDIGTHLTGLEEFFLDLEEQDIENHMKRFHPHQDLQDTYPYPEYEFIA